MEERFLYDRDTLDRMLNLMEHQFGLNCEIVLHDLSGSYEHTIVDIRNGHITGRHVGDCGSNLGLEVIRGTVKNGDRYNYITHTRNGKIMRSSTIYFRDKLDTLYALCVNSDITESVKLESYLHAVNGYTIGDTSDEVFVNNVTELMEHFLLKGQEEVGREASAMNKDEKMKLLEYLDNRGAFLISKSGKRVCEVLNISKNTLYTYLEAIRKNPDNGTGKRGLELDFEGESDVQLHDIPDVRHNRT